MDCIDDQYRCTLHVDACKMAASKRKQDEKHLKILRELGSLLHNKQCFDCHQRGPTYVNMTIGSFVCTSCSGVLRGLNPPHRVKSISMTSFTPEEIEFITSRGNEYCRRVWLGTWNPRTMTEPDAKDQLLVQKYEKKTWYVEPSAAFKSQPMSASSLKQFRLTPVPVEEPYTSVLTSNHVKPLNLQNNQSSVVNRPAISTSTSLGNITSKKGFDLLADLGGDPFSASVSPGGTANHANANFANFENFPAAMSLPTLPRPPSRPSSPTSSPVLPLPNFLRMLPPCPNRRPAAPANHPDPPRNPTNGALSNGSEVPYVAGAGSGSAQSTPALSHEPGMSGSTAARSFNPNANAVSPPPPPKDKYAALADLDCLFHVSEVGPEPVTVTTVSDWEAPVSSNPFAISHPGWNQDTSTTLSSNSGNNPFAKGFRDPAPNNFAQFAPLTSPQSEYHGTGFPVTGHFGPLNGSSVNVASQGMSWTGFGTQTVQQTPFGPGKAVQFANWPQQTVTTNPFVSGATNALPPRSNSNNPFL